LICLLYEAYYSHLLQVEELNPAFVFPFKFLEDIKPPIQQIIKKIITLDPQRQKLEFTGQHYATVAQSLIRYYGHFLDDER